MVTEISNSAARPEATRRTPQFCGNILDASISDLHLKANVVFIAKHVVTGRSTEDLIDAAKDWAAARNFTAIKINDRWSAIAVLAGVR